MNPLLEVLMTALHPARTSQSTSKFGTPVQNAALAVGAVFLAVGVLGFVPGTTTNYDQLTFAGHHSDAALLGIFNLSVLYNLVHLAFGVAGIALARTFKCPLVPHRWGVVYLVLFICGLVIEHDSSAKFVPVNDADNWPHPGLAVAMIALGAALGRRREDTGRPVGTDGRTQNGTPNGAVR